MVMSRVGLSNVRGCVVDIASECQSDIREAFVLILRFSVYASLGPDY